jgi:hypothetical protein
MFAFGLITLIAYCAAYGYNGYGYGYNAANDRARCNQFFAQAKVNCGQYGTDGDEHGNCITRASQEFDACIASEDAYSN